MPLFKKTHPCASLLLLLALTVCCRNGVAQTVRFHTNLGDIDVNLLPDAAPKTVANFLNYLNRGSYDNSIFHRSVAGFIVQGGGYQLQNHVPVEIPQDPAVVNEYKISNTRGTISMAKLGTDANSATNQWFFNLADNSANLDTQNGGFTAFGRIANAAGLAVMDKIGAVPVYNASTTFDSIPLMNYSGTAAVQDQNFVLVNSVTVLAAAVPTISAGGIVTASNFGGGPAAAPGSFIEIYGSTLAGTTRQWGSSDFVNGNAPTTLDNVSVTVNGQAAFVYFVSPSQVNVQIPANVPSGGPVPVSVTYKGDASAPVMLTINPVQPGLYAPASYKVNGKQYVAAIHSATGTFVTTGRVPIIPSPALPGETLIFYGVGFGPVTPAGTAIAGQVVQGLSAVTTPVQFSFGNSVGKMLYAGLVPGLVGLYQFNVTVPMDVANGDVPLPVTAGGSPIAQTLYIPVQSPN